MSSGVMALKAITYGGPKLYDERYKDDPEIREARKYISEHSGQQIMERISAQGALVQQIKAAIEKKENTLFILKSEGASDESIEKLEKEIEQLNDVYTKLNPERLATPEQQEMELAKKND